MQIELTHEEVEALAVILHEHCRELQFEIAHTDHREYKRSLVERLTLVEGVLVRITAEKKDPVVMDAA